MLINRIIEALEFERLWTYIIQLTVYSQRRIYVVREIVTSEMKKTLKTWKGWKITRENEITANFLQLKL